MNYVLINVYVIMLFLRAVLNWPHFEERYRINVGTYEIASRLNMYPRYASILNWILEPNKSDNSYRGYQISIITKIISLG